MSTHATVYGEGVLGPVKQVLSPVASKPFTSLPYQKALFADSLLEASSGHRKRRTCTTVLSFVLEILFVGIVILIPLWFTEVLPKQELMTMLEAPPPPPPPPPPAAPAATTAKVVKVMSDIANGQLRTPSSIPTKVQMIKEDDAPPPIATTGGVVGGVPGGIPGGQLGGVIGGIISSTSTLASVPTISKPVTMPTRVRISQGVSKGLLISRVEPTYPPLARQARIQGNVVLTAVIDKDGTIQNLQVVSGHPMLTPAAIDAVKQWRYKPYLLNGQAILVETTVTVTFSLRTE
jgi:periplasmic protein TonB